jgi:hypothetical protein
MEDIPPNSKSQNNLFNQSLEDDMNMEEMSKVHNVDNMFSDDDDGDFDVLNSL